MTTVKELAGTIKKVASVAEFSGQESAIVAVLEELQTRGAAPDELTVFEKRIRNRIAWNREPK